MDFDRQQKALKELFAKGEAPDAALFKLTVPDHVKSETLADLQRKFTFIISSGALDRDGDTVDPHAWDTKNFMDAGGPVLFAHKADQPPVGKTERIYNAGGKLKAEHITPPRGAYPFADTISDLVDFGALKATSVGFKPKGGKVERNEKGGFDFTGQELLEWSIVPIPSNPEALREAKRANVGDFRPLKDWAERVLEESEGAGLWLPKAAVENVLKIASGEKVTISLSPTIKVPAAGAAGVRASDGATHAAAGTPIAKIHEPKIEERDGEFAVVDTDGKVYGKHKTKAEAEAQVRALYANKSILPLIASKGETVSTTKAAPPPPPAAAAAPAPPAAAPPAAAPPAPMTLQAAIDAGAGSIVEAFTNAVQSVADAKPDNAEELLQGIADEFTAMALASMGAADAQAATPPADSSAPPAAEPKTAPPPPPKKAGRVLSRANEEALAGAVGVIQSILGQVKPPKDTAEDAEHNLPDVSATADDAGDAEHEVPDIGTTAPVESELPKPKGPKGNVGDNPGGDAARDAGAQADIDKPAASQVYREPAQATSGSGAPNEGSPGYGKNLPDMEGCKTCGMKVKKGAKDCPHCGASTEKADPSKLFAFAPDGAVVPLVTKAPADVPIEVTPDLIKSLVRDTLAAERAKARGRLPD